MDSVGLQPVPAKPRAPLTWRGLSIPALALLALGPLLLALINLMLIFWLVLQAAHAHVPPRQQSWIAIAYAVTYTISPLLAGRWTAPRRAMLFLIGAPIGMAMLATAAFFCAGATFPVLLALALGDGLVAAQYSVSFQARMGDVKPFQTLAWSVAFYNASWGMGGALGPMVTGSMVALATAALVGTAWLITAVHLALILAANRTSHGHSQVQMHAAFTSTPQQRRRGWVASFLVMAMYLGVLTTLYPGLGVTHHWSDKEIGLGGMVLGMGIPVTAPLFALLRARLTRPWILAGTLVLAAAAMVALPYQVSWPMSLLCLACMGVGFAGGTFHSVYYVNADPVNPARSIGINEALVGSGCTLGPLFMGLLAWSDFATRRPYWVWAALLLTAAVMFIFQDQRSFRRVAQSVDC